MDCSPRGDAAPAVHIIHESALHIPDRRGNNRLDSLRNIVVDGRVALLFLVPGVSECLRVNGSATLSTQSELLERYAVDGRAPRSVIVVAVESVYFQCARAIKRAGLWGPGPLRRSGLGSQRRTDEQGRIPRSLRRRDL